MLVSFSHGQIVPLTVGQTAQDCSSLGYLAPDAALAPFTAQTLNQIDDLHRQMVETGAPTGGNHSSLPAVFTYFGQFVDHDITAVATAQGAAALPPISDPNLSPVPRTDVSAGIVNARTGGLDLDSLYGRGTETGNPALDKLTRLLRFPGDRAKMWIGRFGDETDRVSFPRDPGGDLLRMDRLLETGTFTEVDIDALPDTHRRLFRFDDGRLNRSRAIIGDARNDENLFIAQLHLAFLRFHNRVVDAWPKPRRAGDADEVFAWARMHVRRFYQWLIVNVWLPNLCDPKVVRDILAEGPVLFDDFLSTCGWTAGARLPIPLEFATGAYRFGHSMVRANYDWNANFPDASFDLMFLFTGSSPDPMAGTGPRLPGNWGADWDRLVHPISAFAARSTRRIDTVLADPLTRMANEGADPIDRNLLARNLRRGILHNLPTAQVLAGHMAGLGLTVDILPEGRLADTPVGRAGFGADTPLWAYTLAEAELTQRGQRLGPMGSHVVAGTILGLILRGADPVWDAPGSHEGRWHPVDGPRVSGQLVDSFPALMRAALLMENPDA